MSAEAPSGMEARRRRYGGACLVAHNPIARSLAFHAGAGCRIRAAQTVKRIRNGIKAGGGPASLLVRQKTRSEVCSSVTFSTVKVAPLLNVS